MTAVEIFVPGQARESSADLPDLDSKANIDAMVHGFYRRLLEDPVMAPVFFEVAGIDLNKHLPIICQYWHKMLLGDRAYQRHMMEKHRALDDKLPLTGAHHERWLGHFMANLEGRFAGPNTDRARRLAARIMDNLYLQLQTRRSRVG
ncbi:group III truncated hemoglobin [Alcanivorax sp. S6407]|uniref:group III truncated hemoglobin n=1 Tax=Alcanivorax sp. S6407 TaxID=2926424 RepID=UPI001FF543E2|nr:group III truncated hemoglobin [Alcanivorax sp. S6407]MCK0153040.1 group III truncated hemoglobin [Alcanivorax sp. S6407]